jgi:sugar-phosphatase
MFDVQVHQRVETLLCQRVKWDLDGTLVNSIPLLEQSWHEFADYYRLNRQEVVELSHGRPALGTMLAILEQYPHLGFDPVVEADKVSRRQEELLEGVEAIPGARSMLRWLGRCNQPIVIYTSTLRQAAERRMQIAGLPKADVLISPDHPELPPGKCKPEPDGLHLASRLIGFERPDQVVFVEDGPPGIHAAHKAGMWSVGIEGTFQAHQLPAHKVVRSLKHLRVKRLSGGWIRITGEDPRYN